MAADRGVGPSSDLNHTVVHIDQELMDRAQQILKKKELYGYPKDKEQQESVL